MQASILRCSGSFLFDSCSKPVLAPAGFGKASGDFPIFGSGFARVLGAGFAGETRADGLLQTWQPREGAPYLH